MLFIVNACTLYNGIFPYRVRTGQQAAFPLDLENSVFPVQVDCRNRNRDIFHYPGILYRNEYLGRFNAAKDFPQAARLLTGWKRQGKLVPLVNWLFSNTVPENKKKIGTVGAQS